MKRKKEITKEKALARLTSLCGRSEQCEYELNLKMLRWGLSAADRREVVEYLKENRYVDDSRYARSYASDKARFSAWGPNKIRFELAGRRIKGPVITEALQKVDQQIWKEGLLRNAVAKSKSLDLMDEEEGYANCRKLFQYLIGRGFPSSACSRVVKVMKKKQEEEREERNEEKGEESS